MKHPIVAARTRARPTVSELREQRVASDAEHLLKRGMVPGVLITEGTQTVLLLAVNIHGHASLPPALFVDSCPPGMLRQASLVLVCGLSELAGWIPP